MKKTRNLVLISFGAQWTRLRYMSTALRWLCSFRELGHRCGCEARACAGSSAAQGSSPCSVHIRVHERSHHLRDPEVVLLSVFGLLGQRPPRAIRRRWGRHGESKQNEGDERHCARERLHGPLEPRSALETFLSYRQNHDNACRLELPISRHVAH